MIRMQKKHDENLNETLESVFRSIEMSAQGKDSEKKENIRLNTICLMLLFL